MKNRRLVKDLPSNAVEVQKNLFVTPEGECYGIKHYKVKGIKITHYQLGLMTAGYSQVHHNRKQYSVHRLVAKAFIPNPENKSQVNHIDTCKTNNNISNLEWVTNSENMIHAKANGIQVGRLDRPVIQMDMFGVIIKEHTSLSLAAKFVAPNWKVAVTGIHGACNGKYKSSRGFKWRYSD